MKKKIIVCLCAVAFVGVVAVILYNHFKLYRFKGFDLASIKIAMKNEKCVLNPMQNGGGHLNFFIAHAGGAMIENHQHFTYTNSKEALLQSIDEGFKFIELDLMLDSDGEIFAAHDYEHFYKITNAKFEDKNALQSPPSKDYLKKAKIYGRFSVLDKEAINAIFMENENIFLVTDKLNDFEALNTQFSGFKDRIIIEAFGVSNYFKARKMGFKYAMLSTNDINLAKSFNIPMIAAHTSILQSQKGIEEAQDFIANGGCIMLFSSNEKAFIDKHKGKSVTQFYVDNYDIKQNRCKFDDKSKCRTY